MKFYYYVDKDKVRQGPLPLEDMYSCDITPNTLVWCKGMPKWERANDVDEMSILFNAHSSNPDTMLGEKDEMNSPENMAGKTGIPHMCNTDVTPVYMQRDCPTEESHKTNYIFYVLPLFLLIGGAVLYLILRPSSSASPSESKSLTEIDVEKNETPGISSKERTCEENNHAPHNRDLVFSVGGVSFCLKFVEGGTFIMGATDEHAEFAEKEEYPTHSVTLHDYYLGETEVTQELWEEIMGYNPANTIGESLPIENISWNDCADFIRELNNRTGKTFRLPTEAEWEYAARGGIYSRQCVHSGSDNAEEVGWVKSNCNGSTHPVGTRNPNELGIYDMTGNVCEWCQDWMSNYTSTDQINPVGPNSGTARVGRGGGWCNSSLKNRVSTRFAGKTTYRDYNLGFRIAM